MRKLQKAFKSGFQKESQNLPEDPSELDANVTSYNQDAEQAGVLGGTALGGLGGYFGSKALGAPPAFRPASALLGAFGGMAGGATLAQELTEKQVSAPQSKTTRLISDENYGGSDYKGNLPFEASKAMKVILERDHVDPDRAVQAFGKFMKNDYDPNEYHIKSQIYDSVNQYL